MPHLRVQPGRQAAHEAVRVDCATRGEGQSVRGGVAFGNARPALAGAACVCPQGKRVCQGVRALHFFDVFGFFGLRLSMVGILGRDGNSGYTRILGF